MAAAVLHCIATSLQQLPLISLMMDETKEVSSHEQATIILHHVTSKMEVLEELIGIYHVPSIDSETVVEVVDATSLFARQEGSTVMVPVRCMAQSGVAARILAEEPHALYIHALLWHFINLACVKAQS